MVFAINNVNANVNNALNVLSNVAGMAVRGCANLVTSIAYDYSISDCPKSGSMPDGKGKRFLRERCDHGLHECHHTRQSMQREICSVFNNTVLFCIWQFLQSTRLDLAQQLMPARVTNTRMGATRFGSHPSVNSTYRSLSSTSFSSN